MKLIDPRKLNEREWNRLASLAGEPGKRPGLKREDWGEAWIALQDAARSLGGPIEERLAVSVLRWFATRNHLILRDRAQNCDLAA